MTIAESPLLRWIAYVVFCLFTVACPRRASACRVSGSEVNIPVTVSPPGQAPFVLTTTDIAVDARLGGSDRASVRVRGRLEFAGTAELAALPAWIRTPTRLNHGTVRLAPGVSAALVSASARDVVARLRFDSVGDVSFVSHVPCASLALMQPEISEVEAEPEDEGASEWIAVAHTLQLSVAPGRSSELTLEIREPSREPFTQLGGAPGWLHVRWLFQGTVVEGWVPRAAMRRDPGNPYGSDGLQGRTASMGYDPPGGAYRGPATIRVGTKVRATPQGVVWATLTNDRDVEVFIRQDSDDWVALSSIPGLSSGPGCDDLHAFVPRSAVTLPPKVPEPGQTHGRWSMAPPYPGPASTSLTVTRLTSGSLLVIGGRTNGKNRAQCWLFDPVLARWTKTASLHVARSWHTATLLADGRLLVIGGAEHTADETRRLELYDPTTGTWQRSRAPDAARHLHTAVRLQDGRVLVAGGEDDEGLVMSTALYDPATDAWVPAGDLASGRIGHTATLLADGRVLLVGGMQREPRPSIPCPWVPTYLVLKTAELFDPTKLQWVPAPAPLHAHADHTASLLADGSVLIVGGIERATPSDPFGTATVEHFVPRTETWTEQGTTDPAYDFALATSVPSRHDAYWPCPRRNHSATTLANGAVLILGGDVTKPRQPTVFDPSRQRWLLAPRATLAHRFHSATLLLDGRVLVLGGTTGERYSYEEGPTTAVEIFEPQ